MIYFWIAMICIAVFTWSGDYASATMARMTNNPAWLTKSYKRDRVLNGLELAVHPYETPYGDDYIRVTYTNPTRYSYTLRDGNIKCGGIDDFSIDWSGDIASHYIPARSSVSYDIATGEKDQLKLWTDIGHMKGKEWVYSRWGCDITFS